MCVGRLVRASKFEPSRKALFVCVCAHHLSHTHKKVNETITGDHSTYDAIFASPRRRHDNDRA